MELALLTARRQQSAGRFVAAHAVLKRALSIAPESPALLDALGSVEQDMGEHRHVEQTYLRALNFARRIAGRARVAALLDNLATLYTEAGEYSKTERILAELRNLSLDVNRNPAVMAPAERDRVGAIRAATDFGGREIFDGVSQALDASSGRMARGCRRR